MDNKQENQPGFSRTMIKGIPYYRTRITDADGKRVSLYARTEKELAVKLAMVPVAKRSEAIYSKVNMLFKSIFYSAEYSNLISDNPTKKLNAKGGVPKKEKEALTDEQAKKLLDTIRGLPYVFVMIGLYAGLRREEILGLQWDCVFLDVPTPYISVRRAWHEENNRPVINTELKTKAARRDVPIPNVLVECLREDKPEELSAVVNDALDTGK